MILCGVRTKGEKAPIGLRWFMLIPRFSQLIHDNRAVRSVERFGFLIKAFVGGNL